MAAIASTVLGKALGRSTIEKDFRPTLAKIGDFATYSLIFISLLIIPKTVTHWVGVTCNFCGDICGGNFTNRGVTDPGYNPPWFCSDKYLVQERFILGTYSLLIIAIALKTIGLLNEKRKAAILHKFCSLLARENILEGTDYDEIRDVDEFQAYELRNELSRSRGFFFHSLVGAAVKSVSAFLFLHFLGEYINPLLNDHTDYICEIQNKFYNCLGSPGYFLYFSLMCYMALLSVYMGCNLATLYWLLPCFGRFRRVMKLYRKNIGERGNGGIADIYLRNRDLRILLDLLALKYGISHSIAAMTLFDEDFRDALKPEIKRVVVEDDLRKVRVWIEAPKIPSYVTEKVTMKFVAEISSPAQTILETFKSCSPDPDCLRNGDIETGLLGDSLLAVTFDGLKNVDCNVVKIWTVVDGKKITGVTQTVEEQKGIYPRLTN